MAHQRISVSGLSDDENDLINGLLAQLDARSLRNQMRVEYYDNKRALRQLSAIMPGHYNELGLVLGWASKAVDALARRCSLDGFTWPDGDLDKLGMRELQDENQLLSEFSGAVTNSFKLGVSFLINTTGAQGEPKSLIHAKDALNATGTWNSRTRTLTDLVSVTARDKDDRPSALALYLHGHTITIEKDNGWQVVDRQDHLYGVPAEPVVYRPQGRPFGYSRISRPIMGLQDAGVRALLRMEGHLDVYSWPEMIILGADAGAFQDENGNQLPGLQAMLGRIKGIPDDEEQPDPSLARAEVKQIPASSPEPHLAALNALAKMFAREASLPDSAVAITDMANPTSSDSYDASQYELIAEAEGAVDDFTRPLSRSVRRGLAILNGVPEQPKEWATIGAKWRNPRFESRSQAADAGTKQLAITPWLAETALGLELLGFSEDQIRRAMAEKRRAEGRQALTQIAETMATQDTPQDLKAKFDALGVAIRTGVDPEDAAKRVGLAGIEFTGATPVSLRLPESDAARLEEK